MMENKRGVSTAQLLLLLDELETNPALGHESVLMANKNIYDDKWEQLVDKLNAVPNGAKRSVPRWKTVLNNWKLTIKRQANTDENMDNPEALDELGKRLLRLVEVEDVIQDIDQEVDTENDIVFRRPLLRRSGRRRARVTTAGLGRDNFLSQFRRQKSLKTLFGNNVDHDGSPENLIMQQQLDRLYLVSQELENHIQSVQNRIQKIKDMWQHECIDE